MDKENIERALEESGRILYQYLNFSMKDKKHTSGASKGGVMGFYTYLISHEAERKGYILLSAKHAGFELRDGLKQSLAEWGKL